MLPYLKERLEERLFGKNRQGDTQTDPARVTAEEMPAIPPEIDLAQVAAASIDLLSRRITVNVAKIAVLGGPSAYNAEPDIVRLTTALEAEVQALTQLTGSSKLASDLVRATDGKLRLVGEEGIRFTKKMLGFQNLVGALLSSDTDPRDIFSFAQQTYKQGLFSELNIIDQDQK